jgi:hypothetical protein
MNERFLFRAAFETWPCAEENNTRRLTRMRLSSAETFPQPAPSKQQNTAQQGYRGRLRDGRGLHSGIWLRVDSRTHKGAEICGECSR